MSTGSQYLSSRPVPLGGIQLPLAGFDPLFGHNPFSAATNSNAYLGGNGLPDYALMRAQRIQQTNALLAQAAQLRAASLMSGADLTDLNPNDWTEKEAIDQTSLGLAKLATVNPELAAKLAAKRAGTPVQNRGFMGDLASVLGEVLHGGAEIGGALFDIIGRSMNIVPNIAYDLVDGGEFSPLTDFTDAVTGEVRHNWNSVLQEIGLLEGDGWQGALRATIGFGLDIATDPLTYLFVGAKGLGMAEGSLNAAKQAALANETILQEAARVAPDGMKATEWLADKVGELFGESVQRYADTITRLGSMDFDERVAFFMTMTTDAEQAKVLEKAYSTIDAVYNASRTGEIGKVLKDGFVRIADGETVPVTRELFDQIIKPGKLQSLSRAEWAKIRAIRESLPGISLRLSVPFTGLRFLSPVLPYTGRAGLLFNGFRKFLAGQAGAGRIMTLIQEGKASPMVLKTWMEDGWSGVARKHEEVSKLLKGWQTFGTGLYSASQEVGKLTGAFSEANRMSRIGLMGYLGYREKKSIEERIRRFIYEATWSGLDAEGNKIDRKQLNRIFTDAGLGFDDLSTKLSPEDQLKFIRYMELPDDVALQMASGALTPENARALLEQRWVTNNSRISQLAEGSAERDVLEQKMRTRVDEAVELMTTMPEAQKKAADMLRSIQEYARGELGKTGHGLGTVKANVNEVNRLHPSQIHLFETGREALYWPNPDRHTGYIYSEVTGSNIESSLLGGAEQHAHGNGVAYGVEVHATPQNGTGKAGATEATIRLNKPLLELNLDPSKADDQKVLDEIVADIEDLAEVAKTVIEESPSAAKAKGPLVLGAEADSAKAQLVTEKLAKNYDGIIYRNADGSLNKMLIFDPSNVKVVDDAADLILYHRGYAPRVLSARAKEFIRGKVSAAERRVIWKAPEIEAEISRATIDMTWEEADAHIRQVLREKFALLGEDLVSQLDEIPHMLEINPLVSHLEYVDKLGLSLGASLVNDYMRRLIKFHNIAPSMFTNSPRQQRYEYLIDPRIFEALKRLDARLAPRIEKLQARMTKLTEAQHARAVELEDMFTDFHDGLAHGLGLGDEVLDRHVVALRRFASLHGDIGEAIANARRALVARKKEVEAEREVWIRARTQADRIGVMTPEGQRLVSHVAPGEPMRITVLNPQDGTVRVEGWHGSFQRYIEEEDGSYVTRGGDDVRTQVTQQLAEGESFATRPTGALHVGDYTAARDRTLQNIETHYREDDVPFILMSREVRDAQGNVVFEAMPAYSVFIEDMDTGEVFTGVVQSLPNPSAVRASKNNARRRTSDMVDDAIQQLYERGSINKAAYEATGESSVADALRNSPDVHHALGGFLKDADPETFNKLAKEAGSRKYSEVGKIAARRMDAEDVQSILTRYGYTAPGADMDVLGRSRLRVKEMRPATADEIDEVAWELDIMFETVDDYIHPVAFEGKLRPENFNKKGEVIGLIEEDINPVFTSGTRKELGDGTRGRPLTQAENKRKHGWSPEELEAMGHQAVVYTNAHENIGSLSIAAVDPHAVKQNDVLEELYTRARAGQLYVSEDGRFLTKEGYFKRGGKDRRARPFEDIEDELHVIRKEMDLVRQAEKEQDSRAGRGAVAMAWMLGDTGALEQAAQKVADTLTGAAGRMAGKSEQLAKRLERYGRQITTVENELNKIYAEAQGMVAQMKPALVTIDTTKGAMAGLTPLTVPGMHGYAAPTFLANELNRLFETRQLGDIHRFWRKFVVGPWKRWATYRWPGFHVRNIMGAWFNNLLGGVDLIDYDFALRMRSSNKWFRRPIEESDWDRLSLHRIFPPATKGKITYEDLASLLADDGISRAGTFAVFTARTGLNDVREEAGLRSVAKRGMKVPRMYDDMMRSVGGGVEEFFRMAAWSRGMASASGDRFSARAFVMLRHGDYSDLSQFEENLRTFIPFYKWMRTNIPYQFRMMIEQPGMYAALAQSEVAATEILGRDWQQTQALMPQWMRESYAVPMPDSVTKVIDRIPGMAFLLGSEADKNAPMKFMMFDLPYKDLYMGLTDYMSAGLPVVRQIVESLGFGNQLFSSRPLTGKYIPAASWLTPFLPVVSKAAALVGSNPVRRGFDGKWYIEDKFENILTAWPVYSKFRGWLLDSKDTGRYTQRLSILSSAILGISLKPGDYIASELDFYYNEIQPMLDQYRSLGVQFPTADDFASPEVGSFLGQFSTSFQPVTDGEGFITAFQRSA